MIRKEPLIKMIEYIGHDYYNNFVITSDDMLMNIITYQYANNYSNIYLPGYMYNIRQVSMSRGNGGEKLTKIRAINHYLYFSTFYRYIKDFNKDLNFLFYELEDLQHYMRYIKDYKIVNYIPKAIKLFNKILNDQFASKRFKQFAKNMILYYKS